MKHYGLIGRNISYSISPELHNKAFVEAGVEAEYSIYDLPNLTDFREVMKKIDGANITIPYKQAVIPMLDRLTHKALVVGAVNTICKHKGKLVGDNTDCDGFFALLDEAREVMRKNEYEFQPNDCILVLGNGGAAKAVIYVLDNIGLKHNTATHSQMNEGCINIENYRMVVNATPNHHPNINYDGFCSGKCAIDLTYNPNETDFLAEARTKGAFTFNGMTMLKKQAECARKLWIEDN